MGLMGFFPFFSVIHKLTEGSTTEVSLKTRRDLLFGNFVFGVVSRCGLAVRRLAGKQKDLGSIRFGSSFSSLQKLWFMDTVL